MWPIPPSLDEALTGWVALMLPFIIWSAVRYLVHRRKLYDSFSSFYLMNKMPTSLMFLFLGLEIRTITEWMTRHLNHHGTGVWLAEEFLNVAPVTFVIGYSMLALGAICWARVAAGMPVTKARIWVASAGTCALSFWLAFWSPW